MLVLSRKVGQTIVIGDGIEITVVEIRGDQVRLGIDAPRNVPVNRKEILSRPHSDLVGAKGSPGATLGSSEIVVGLDVSAGREMIAPLEIIGAREGGSLREALPPRQTGNEVLAAVAEPIPDPSGRASTRGA